MMKSTVNCPNDHGKMSLKKVEKQKTFRGIKIKYQAETYICDECGISVGTIEQAAAIQNTIADAYRETKGLLTGNEIKRKRKELGWTQKELSRKAGVGVVSIKRWENGIIQTKSMDKALKSAFDGRQVGNPYTGNRAAISIPRIKLVMIALEEEVGCKFLVDGDKLLFDVKYLWYVDMLAFKEIGQSVTGATYAALPFGPQLNNYNELISLIRAADETKAETLTEEEKRIIIKVAAAFPRKKMAYDAAHREQVWKKRNTGALIPYTDASELTEI
ncbi:MAG: helix-turn-helix domain-containing protein [Proteobacteria bacterium]|nr:helix-turn-helix domain-containing protein [Pseudomonadota bacterium]